MGIVSVRKSRYSVTAIYEMSECGIDWTATVLGAEGLVDTWSGEMSPALVSGRSVSDAIGAVLSEKLDGLPL